MQPPAQELMARDLHDNMWNFRHIYRGMSSCCPCSSFIELFCAFPIAVALPFLPYSYM